MHQKLFIPLFFFIGWQSICSAQQLPLFTQYREYHGFINPASINSDYLWNEYPLSFGVSSRTQWKNQSYTPRTLFARGEYVYSGRGSLGFVSGGYIIKDDIDPFSSTGIHLRLGVLSLGLGGDHFSRALSVGFTGGLTQYRLNTTELNIRDIDDEEIVNATAIDYDLGVGVFYHQRLGGAYDFIYVGASIPQIRNNQFQLNDGIAQINYQKNRHYYGLLGYYKALGEYQFVEFSAWVNYVSNVPFRFDANVRYQFEAPFWIGFGYGHQGSSYGFQGVGHVDVGIMVDLNDSTRAKIGFGCDYSGSIGSRFGPAYEFNVSLVISE